MAEVFDIFSGEEIESEEDLTRWIIGIDIFEKAFILSGEEITEDSVFPRVFEGIDCGVYEALATLNEEGSISSWEVKRLTKLTLVEFAGAPTYDFK